MNDELPKPGSPKSAPRKKGARKARPGTSSIKLNQNLKERNKAKRDARARKKAEYLATLPKSRARRILYRMHPKRVAAYWFSRDGAIMALKIVGIGIALTFIFVLSVFAYFRKDLPNLKDVSGNDKGGSIRYYDRTGQILLWEDFDSIKRLPVKGELIAQDLKDATVAIEDKEFYNHGGFNVRGIARAAVNDITKNGGRQGGSTITQQLVKINYDWTRDATYKRKVKELILAVELERTYSKNEILTGYLNNAPYGAFETGAEAASQTYFNKPAKDLTLDEAAFFAAIPKSPTFYSSYSPDFEKDEFVGRQHYILDLMAQQGKITVKERDEAKKIDTVAKVKPRTNKYSGIKAPYFVLTAREQLINDLTPKGYSKGGLKVTTTLDMHLQNLAEQQVQKGIKQVIRQGGDEIAFAAEDVHTGQMVALVGGVDFNNPDHGQNNYAHDYRLPPGSSFKPYDYISLMENTTNVGAGTVLYDQQGPLDGYPCTKKGLPPPKGDSNCLQNYDFRYPGPLTVRYALGGSRNVPAVKSMLIAGVDKTIAIANKLGISDGYKCYQDEKLTKEGQCYASSAIGDGAYLKLDQHVHAYGSISRNGNVLPQAYYLKVEDDSNKTVREWKQSKGDQVIRPDSAYIVSDILSDPNASYFPAGRKPHRYTNKQGTWKFSMKTGTTNDAKDGWMMGFSTQYAAGVWVGYHNRNRVMTGTMEGMTQPVWQGWMQAAHEPLKPEERVKPASVKTAPAFVVRSHVGIGSVEPSPANDLYPSWYQPKAGSTKKVTIDTVSNKLATDCTPPLARRESTEGDVTSFSGDTFVGTAGANTNATDDVHKCDDAKPTVALSVSGDDGSYTLIATVSAGTHPLKTVNFLVNGQVIPNGTFDASTGTTTFSVVYNATDSGTVTAQVIDNVLYDATDQKSVDGGGGGNGSLTLADPGDESSSGTSGIDFNWTGNDNAPYKLMLRAPGSSSYSQVCPTTPSTSCTANVSTNGDYSARVVDKDGNQSNVITFHKGP